MSEQPIYGFFVAIPEKTLQSKQWRALKATTRCVYTTMLLRYRRAGVTAGDLVTWAQTELVETTGFSLSTVIRGLDELKDKEWLWIWEPGGRWAKGTTYRVNPLYANGKDSEAT